MFYNVIIPEECISTAEIYLVTASRGFFSSNIVSTRLHSYGKCVEYIAFFNPTCHLQYRISTSNPAFSMIAGIYHVHGL